MRKFFLFAFCAVVLSACDDAKKDEPAAASTTASATDKKPMLEIMDMSSADVVKKSNEAFAKGDIDAMTADFDDNIRYTWSGGDSLIGKKAVQDYWKARWGIIESLSFSEHIFVPVLANESQSQYAPAGKWILHWNMVNAKYKNGKSTMFWSHSVNHLNDAGKIDFIGMYYDRAPLNKATEGMTLPK
jgi:SnoaL-like domain